jgi:hypothetical protein
MIYSSGFLTRSGGEELRAAAKKLAYRAIMLHEDKNACAKSKSSVKQRFAIKLYSTAR